LGPALLAWLGLRELETARIVAPGERRRSLEANAVSWPAEFVRPYVVQRAQDGRDLGRAIPTKELVEQAPLDVHESATLIPNVLDVSEAPAEACFTPRLEVLRDAVKRLARGILGDSEAGLDVRGDLLPEGSREGLSKNLESSILVSQGRAQGSIGRKED
jgi:hypothetical protein